MTTELDLDTWGLADVEAAIAAIPLWIESVAWRGPGVDIESWYVVGHSNGGMARHNSTWFSLLMAIGQGTWFALTHRPDKVLAAAPVSGYSSIQCGLRSEP